MCHKSFELQDLWIPRIGDVVHDILTGLNGVVVSITDDSCYMVLNIRNILRTNEPLGTGFLRVPFSHHDPKSSTAFSRVIWLPKLDDYLDLIDKTEHSDVFSSLQTLTATSYEDFKYDSLEHFMIEFIMGLDQWCINGKLCNRSPLTWINNEWVSEPQEDING